MLWKFLLSMVLAYIIEMLILRTLVQFFEWRFFKKANAFLTLYKSIYTMLEDKFNNDNSMKVSIKYEYCKSKIKFRNALEASIKLEILLQRVFRNYYIVEFIMSMIDSDLDGTEMKADKEELEEICHKIRMLTSDNQEEQTQEEL